MTAFEKWFKKQFENDVTAGAIYLFDCCMTGPSDSTVWQYLEKTGDEYYTIETFKKASKELLKGI